MKSVLFLIWLVIHCCSGFSFQTPNGWYETAEAHYELQQLPTTYVINCDEPGIQCATATQTKLYEYTRSWLKQHWNKVPITMRTACAVSETGPSIDAHLSCATLPATDPWGPPRYNASDCSLTLKYSMGIGPPVFPFLISTLSVIYYTSFAAVSWIQKRKSGGLLRPQHPRLYRTVPFQLFAFFLLQLTLTSVLHNYYFAQLPCEGEEVSNDIIFLIFMLDGSVLLWAGLVWLLIVSLLREPIPDMDSKEVAVS